MPGEPDGTETDTLDTSLPDATVTASHTPLAVSPSPSKEDMLTPPGCLDRVDVQAGQRVVPDVDLHDDLRELTEGLAMHKGKRKYGQRSSLHPCVQRLLGAWDFVQNKTVWLASTDWFDNLATLMVFVNAVYIGVETELNRPTDGKENDVWFGFEVFFTVFFMLELMVRIVGQGSDFLRYGWNIFDFLLVTISTGDLVISSLLQGRGGDGAEGNLEFVNIMRILRILRLARLIRLLRFFKELWLLVAGVIHSFRTLTWTLVLMVLTIYVFAIVMTRTLGHRFGCDRASAGDSCDGQMDQWWGEVPRSMFTLFQLVTTEGWSDIVRTSMTHNGWMVAFFIVFMFFTSIALMNVMIAVIVENTLENASALKHDAAKAMDKETEKALSKIFEVFTIADVNNDGGVSKDEFLKALQNHEVLGLLSEVQIDLVGAEELFDILDFDESGELDVHEFLDGCMRARGPARSKDILALQCDLWRTQQFVEEKIQNLQDTLEGRFMKLVDNVQWLGALTAEVRNGDAAPGDGEFS